MEFHRCIERISIHSRPRINWISTRSSFTIIPFRFAKCIETLRLRSSYAYIYIYIYRSRLYDDVSKFMKTRYRVFPLSKSYIVARTIVIEDNKFFNQSKFTFDPYETISTRLSLFFSLLPFLPFLFFPLFFPIKKFNDHFSSQRTRCENRPWRNL